MKRIIVLTMLLMGLFGFQGTKSAVAYDFGDYRSATFASRAWEALDKGDIEAVLAYTNKCIELYGEQAKKMQAGLKDYVKSKNEGGSDQDVFANWALNDIATCLFIQGEAYRKAKMNDEAKEVYNKIIKEYTFGQCWDTKGWFWKPAEAAKEKLAALESGSTIDFGDYTSSALTVKAWEALAQNDLESVKTYVKKCLELYEAKAKEMQASLTEYPWGEKDQVFAYWALNDVGTCLFIEGEALRKAGKMEEAKASYEKLLKEYSFAQCWDTNGWFWKPSEAAQRQLDEMKDAE